MDMDKILKSLSCMNGQVVHRGPDDEGIFVKENIGIGMRRLSIIDIFGGRQPIFNEDKSIAVVCNGEVYNFKKLRHILEEKGHQFISHSDTEVIVHAYEEYGMDCFAKFDGMFAIAIYDTVRHQVILARDKAGEKPLYWYQDENVFLFASELKSITKLDFVPMVLSPEGVHQYFTLTYIPAPSTIFQKIYKLPAASFMIIGSMGVEACTSYWDMEYNNECLVDDYEVCKNKLRVALFDAVESRMVSDVPLGTFMSGGIDSSIVTGIASRVSNHPIDTFTIGFEHRDYDERDRAELAAKSFGVKMHTDTLTFPKARIFIDKILEKMDEPFADSSFIPTYFVSQLASDYVKVVLTGDGGDELFAGYSKYLIGYYSKKYNAIPSIITKGILEPALRFLPLSGEFYNKVVKVVNNAKRPLFEQRLHLMQLGCDDGLYSQLVRPAYHASSSNFFLAYGKYENSADEIARTLYTDFKIVLEGDMFVKVDRMSMLHSIETRTPMVASGMLELAPRIPSRFKINRKDQKIILKDAFSDILPKSLMKKSKKGFSVPLEYWLRDEMRGELQSYLDFPSELDEILNLSFVQKLFQAHIRKQENYMSLLWAVYVFARWFRNLQNKGIE